MIFEFVTHDRQLFYTDEERRLFRSMGSNPLPAPGSAVWLGRFAHGTDLRVNFVTVGTDGGSIESGDLQAYTTTMVFGHVALQIVTIKNHQPALQGSVVHPRNRNWRDALLRIWPTKADVRWPPSTS